MHVCIASKLLFRAPSEGSLPNATTLGCASAHASNGARAHLATEVAALQRHDTYPHPVSRVETIETHMSVVFLTESHAYKLKKPIRTALFDHTTIEARRRACEIELALNRRLAPSVYLAVVPLVSVDGSLRVEQPGTAVDWLVKMHRLPRERMLDACIARRAVQAHDVDRLTALLAQFYATAERTPSDGALYLDQIAADIASKQASLKQAQYGLKPDGIDALVSMQRRWIARHGALLQARAACVVNAHGDLRPEHVCLVEDRPPIIIDCLEFNRALRLLDPVSELSFLSLECRRLGAGWIGERLCAGYAQTTGDRVADTLLAFYRSYHALVRAAVAVWHLDDEAIDHSDRWRQRGIRYLELAQQCLSGTTLG